MPRCGLNFLVAETNKIKVLYQLSEASSSLMLDAFTLINQSFIHHEKSFLLAATMLVCN